MSKLNRPRRISDMPYEVKEIYKAGCPKPGCGGHFRVKDIEWDDDEIIGRCSKCEALQTFDWEGEHISQGGTPLKHCPGYAEYDEDDGDEDDDDDELPDGCDEEDLLDTDEWGMDSGDFDWRADPDD